MRSFIATAAIVAGAAIANAAAIERRSTASAVFNSLLSASPPQILAGLNKDTNTSDGCSAWIGDDGTYVTEFANGSDEDIIVFLWGPDASWINVHVPWISQSLSPGESVKVSMEMDTVGAWAAMYGDSKMVNGQLSETWGEFTYNGTGSKSTFDVSREVNLYGHDMTIETAGCTSDMNRCVFKCANGAQTCEYDYQLYGCEAGSQPGAHSGMYYGTPSGGCAVDDESKFVKVTFS